MFGLLFYFDIVFCGRFRILGNLSKLGNCFFGVVFVVVVVLFVARWFLMLLFLLFDVLFVVDVVIVLFVGVLLVLFCYDDVCVCEEKV